MLNLDIHPLRTVLGLLVRVSPLETSDQGHINDTTSVTANDDTNMVNDLSSSNEEDMVDTLSSPDEEEMVTS